jgi:hypothetical protein
MSRLFAVSQLRLKVIEDMTDDELLTAIQINRTFTDGDNVKVPEDLFVALIERFKAQIKRE